MAAKTKKTVVKAPAVPTLEDVLGIMTYHVEHLATCRPGPTSTSTSYEFSAGIGGWEGSGCPLVIFSATIHPTSGDEPWGVWARCEVEGQIIGNRCAARAALARVYAPVIAWVAAYHAARETRAAETAKAVAS